MDGFISPLPSEALVQEIKPPIQAILSSNSFIGSLLTTLKNIPRLVKRTPGLLSPKWFLNITGTFTVLISHVVLILTVDVHIASWSLLHDS
jgi:hypothetical protein